MAEWPSPRGLAVLIFVSLAATLAFVPVFLPLEERMKAAGHGIIEFELTFDPAASTRIVEDWREGDALDEAVLSIEVDFTFLVAYSLLAGALVLWAARRAEGKWQARGFALVPWCAAMGLFDAVENCLGLVTLHAGRGDGWRTPLMTLFASGKFVILALALAYFVRGLAARRAG